MTVVYVCIRIVYKGYVKSDQYDDIEKTGIDFGRKRSKVENQDRWAGKYSRPQQ